MYRLRPLPGRFALAPILCLCLTFAAATSLSGGDGPSHELRAEIGLGYDDNPFLSPDESYFDQINLASVDPQPKGGFYVPAKIRGEYRSGEGARSFVTSYRLSGDFYPESETGNADETLARLHPGVEFRLGGQGRRRNTWYLGPYAAYNKEVFFDRDTGLGAATVGGTDLSNRYTYTAFGVETELRLRSNRAVEGKIDGLFERRNYSESAAIPSLDHDRYRARGQVDFRLGASARLILDYTYQVRDYDERLARDLQGNALTTNPRLEYGYQELGTTLRVAALSAWTLYFDFERTDREDSFVGYNDYTQESFRVRSILRDRNGRRLRIAVESWERDYDNAFIFDEPTNPQDSSANPAKSYETLDLRLTGELPLRERLTLILDYRYRDQEAADPRYTYGRNRAMVGVEWRR